MPNWKKVIISGSDAALNSLEITSHLTASGLIYPTSDGTNGQAITTDAAGNLTFGNPGFADEAEKVTFEVQNGDAGTLAKGTPVHITSMTGGTAIVVAASASVASKMPSHGILNQQLTAGSDGFATILGQVTGVDTSAFSPGDTVYVGSSGGYTNVKPAGSTNLIQNLGVVKKVDASNGTGEIFGSGRTNDVPNLPTGKIWVGDGYTVTSSVVHLDEPNSRLGIGTTSPGRTLDVRGDAQILSTSSTGLRIVGGTTSEVYMIFGDADDNSMGGLGYNNNTNELSIDVNNSEAIRIDSSRNVGIGTTSPDSNLSISTGNVNSRLDFSDERGYVGYNTTYGSTGGIYIDGGGTSNKALILNPTSTGNVGIGTTNPNARLHVKGSGSTSATTALLVEDTFGSDLLEVNDLGNVTIPNGSLSLNGATGTEELNIAGNIAFDSPGGTISGGGVGASLNLSAAGANISIGSANNNIVMTGGVTGSFSGSFEGDGSNLTGITAEWDGTLNGDAEITGSLTVKAGDLLVSGSNDSTLIGSDGGIELGYDAQPVRLNRNKFVLVNSGPDVVATVDSTLHLSAHFDYVIVKLPNLRAGTVMACHDGLGNVVFTETATSDLGSTAGVALDVVEIGGNLELQMTVPTTGWFIKTFVRAI